MTAPPLIEAVHLGKRFGGIIAVNGVDFAVHAGELVGLIGPNGSGKTTLINLLTGHLRPTSGKITVNGASVADLPPEGFAALGVARTFQITQLFSRMSVLENMLVPGLARPRANRAEAIAEARRNLAFLGLKEHEDLLAKALSGGQQKLLELGRALMVQPKIMFLDEPFAGVNPYLRDEIIGYIKQLHSRGQAFVIVDHDIDAMQRLALRMVVMARGRMIADGPLASVRENRDVIRAYTG